MITCTNCQSAQCLQITYSKVTVDEGDIPELTEQYHCTLCNKRGRLRQWIESGTTRVSITGDVEETSDRPRVSPA